MRVIARKRLVAFWTAHRDAEAPLSAWYRELEKAKWTTTAEVKKHYPSASFVGNDRIVFNIKGNKYRLIIRYKPPIVLIRFIGNHSEYDRIDAATV